VLDRDPRWRGRALPDLAQLTLHTSVGREERRETLALILLLVLLLVLLRLVLLRRLVAMTVAVVRRRDTSVVRRGIHRRRSSMARVAVPRLARLARVARLPNAVGIGVGVHAPLVDPLALQRVGEEDVSDELFHPARVEGDLGSLPMSGLARSGAAGELAGTADCEGGLDPEKLGFLQVKRFGADGQGDVRGNEQDFIDLREVCVSVEC
jgi:hypothetical protein